MSGSEDPKMDQNDLLCFFCGHSVHFHLLKVKNQYVVIQSGINLVALIYGVFWENKSLWMYFVGSIRVLWFIGFEKGQNDLIYNFLEHFRTLQRNQS